MFSDDNGNTENVSDNLDLLRTCSLNVTRLYLECNVGSAALSWLSPSKPPPLNALMVCLLSSFQSCSDVLKKNTFIFIRIDLSIDLLPWKTERWRTLQQQIATKAIVCCETGLAVCAHHS
ncbi:hypothetical protein BaRGS_00021401 [Batillaria attramentaria]|uniref:Uncharacterized protein n=1 Tax=Batillaria attramentaria TaxID=370345 RepID=A0ABD0KJW0_9CAEN